MKPLRFFIIIAGFYLAIEGIASLFAFADQDILFQLGRVFRVVIGFVLIIAIAPKLE